MYLRTGDANLAIAPYTTDGDLAINPSLLGDDLRADVLRSSVLREIRRCGWPADRLNHDPSGSGSLPVVLVYEPAEEIAALDLARLVAQDR